MIRYILYNESHCYMTCSFGQISKFIDMCYRIKSHMFDHLYEKFNRTHIKYW